MPKRWMRLAATALLGCLLLASGPWAAAAQPDAGNRRLLEKGLTVYELDREIARLADEQSRLSVRIRETERDAEQASLQIAEMKRKTADVLRSYYTGDRSSIWLAALSVRSVRDALYVWDQLQLIVSRDRRTMDDYRERYRSLKAKTNALEEDRRKLGDTIAAYEAEKQNRIRAQREVERLLAGNAERAKLEKEMAELSKRWEERGLPLFKTYFAALAAAMPKLPELLGQNGGSVAIKGLNPTVEIADGELNRFLQSHDEAFRGFAFSFGDGSITAGGRSDDVTITVQGRYAVENEPANAVRFKIDGVTFNGYPLPASTAQSLERQFDLAFYPGKIAPFLQATGVKTVPGKMTIALKLAL
ncbi:hypothetical protein [Paenibacillus flagellatus]|uniref:SbsC C-terminal domain-containing protein n=1 Tax=Paenibacillus flagellatus TaxID=2211139 RepID=A0A2V5K5H1_9BACL|nr:hypothetical protein [Paenibacillus flagellatus]PYI54601.1 hypothetical protein DLM86_14185 [Paenibacillus flagellatus]